ncbi:MAG: hypothetical protein JJT85_08095 [Chromatiales bacterium]|nr:hypothetical protein [Chromatiales bacterium]
MRIPLPVLLMPLLAACAATPTPTPTAPGGVEFASDEALAEFCAAPGVNCREHLRFRLVHLDGRAYEYSARWAPPVLQDGVMVVFPGEDLRIEAQLRAAGQLMLREAGPAAEPDRTLRVRFSQLEAPGRAPEMALTIDNLMDHPLVFRLFALDPDEDEFRRVRSCGVGGRDQLQLRLDRPVVQLRISAFSWLEPGSTPECDPP